MRLIGADSQDFRIWNRACPDDPSGLAAKQMVTADHVGQGRFGLDIVCGFNRNEFQMFGIPQYEHDMRYEQGQEWWEVVKKSVLRHAVRARGTIS